MVNWMLVKCSRVLFFVLKMKKKAPIKISKAKRPKAFPRFFFTLKKKWYFAIIEVSPSGASKWAF